MALADAKVIFFEAQAGNRLDAHSIAASGESGKASADHNQIYRGLVGYEGFSTQLEQLQAAVDEEFADFDPGALDEERHTESL